MTAGVMAAEKMPVIIFTVVAVNPHTVSCFLLRRMLQDSRQG